MKISIVVPCWNESGNIEAMFSRVTRALSESTLEIIFVDDGSSDSTAKEISALEIRFPEIVKLVQHENNLGVHRSWKSGINEAKYQLICLIDGDLQNPPEAILDLITAYENEMADFVLGSRTSLAGDARKNTTPSRFFNFLTNLIFRTKLSDPSSGFALAPKHILLNVIDVDRKFFFFQRFLGLSAIKRGYKVIDVETVFEPRNIGHSFVGGLRRYLVSVKILADVPRAILEFSRVNRFQLANISENYKNPLRFFRRMLFELYFLTSFSHKWIISRKAKQKYLWLKTTEFLDTEEMRKLQLVRLQELLIFANRHVPYYKSVFDKFSLDPRLVEKLEDLEKVPLLSKVDVRQNIHFRMFSDIHRKRDMHRIKTSGSTGEPFVCYADKFQLEMRFATTLRAYEMAGWRFGDKQLRLWHQTIGMSRSQVFREKIDSIFMRRKFVPAYELSANKIEELIKDIERTKPVIIDGYAESLNFISTFSARTARWSPKAIISSAQELTEKTRASIEETFHSKVHDKYGSREFSGIAYECRIGNSYHVQDESYIVEILVDGRKANPGEVGEIVITDLNNYSTPMIRYRIGDLALAVEQANCQCGRSHSQIGKIYGRTQALVYCTNGVWLPGTFFAHFFKEFDFAIQHFQIFQEDEQGFTLRIVPSDQFSAEIESSILNQLKSFIGANTLVKMRLVENIPLLITGKRTPVISNLRSDFQKIGKNLFTNS